MTEAYPLHWPPGWPRTPERDRRHGGNFQTTPERSRQKMHEEVRKLTGGSPLVISSDVPIRQDGQLYADAARRVIRDPGVAIYFDLGGRPMVMASDRYLTPHHNLHSLALAVEHLRGLERHGGGTMMERAFQGFAALPAPPAGQGWWNILEVDRNAPREVIIEAWKRLAYKHHPDRGGSPEMMAAVNAARDMALSEGVG